MNRYSLPLERFDGAVPQPFAVYQPMILGMLGMLPSTFGIASYAMSDLDAFRSVEEYATYETNATGRLRELNDKYAGQPMQDPDSSEFADVTEILREVKKRKTELQARTELLAELASDERHVERAVPVRTSVAASRPRHVPEDIFALEQYRSLSSSPDDERQALIDGALMAIDRATYPHERADQDAVRADLHKLMAQIDDPDKLARHILATGHPVYQRAVVKGSAGLDLYADEQRMLSGNVRAQTITSGPAGGFAVPFTLDPNLVLTSDGVTNPVRQISRVERTTTGKWHGITSAGVTASYTATEGDEAPAASLTLAQPELEVVEASAFAEYSIRAELSWGSLQASLARAFQDAKDTLEARKFISGTGTGEPNGVVATLSPSSNVWVGGSFGVEDLFNLKSRGINHLPPRFQPRASFLGNSSIYDEVRLLSVPNVGTGTVWADSIRDGTPDRLLGKPAYEASEMDSDLSSSGNDVLVYGDFSNYLILDLVGLTIEVVQHVFGGAGRPKTRRGALAYWMNNSLILTSNAFRKLRTGTGS